MSRQKCIGLFVAVCVASLVFAMYLLQHTSFPLFFTSLSSSFWERSPLPAPSPLADRSSPSSSERSQVSPLSSKPSASLYSQPSASLYSQPSASLYSQPVSSPLTGRLSQATHSTNNFTRVLCVYFLGRLGNELFQYASTLGLALTLKRTPVFLGSHFLPSALKTFNQTSDSSSRLEHRCKNCARATEAWFCKFDEMFTRLNSGQDYTVTTYLQSYRYFEHHEAEIRTALTFNDEVRNESQYEVRELRQKHNTSTLIGVHVRRGDMNSEENIKLGFPQVPPDYLNRSMAFFRSRYPDCVFVVGSNSLQWCKDNVPSGYHVHYLTGHSPAVDMSVMSSMDHTVITVGTFSWWIGFLNSGTTVYMKDFIVSGTFIGRQFNPGGRDYVYPGWIPV